MNEIDKILQKVFDRDVTGEVSDIAQTIIRPRLREVRHPESQSGLVLTEDGSAELRSGHGSDTSFTVHPNGTSTLHSPRGTVFTGPLYHPDLPSDSHRYAYGTLRPNPFWESQEMVYFALPLETLKTLQVMVLTQGSSTPTPMPFLSLFGQAPGLTDADPSV